MSAKSSNRQVFADLAFFTVLAFIFRALFWVLMPRAIDSADAILYLEMAKQFALGGFHGFNERIPILYPLLCAALDQGIGDVELSARWVSLIASSLTVIPFYMLARDMHGVHTARVAALILSVWVWLADYASRETPEALACLLWFSAVWSLSRGVRLGGLWTIRPPIRFFLLNIARPEGLFLMIGAPVAALVLGWNQKKRTLIRLAPYVVTCGVLVGGYAILTHHLLGHTVVNPRVRTLGSALETILVHRGEAVVRAFLSIMSEVFPIMLGPVLLLFAGVGFFHISPLRARDLRLEVYVLLFAALQTALAVASSYPEPRYVMSALIAVSIWSARGVAVVTEQVCANTGNRLLRGLPVAAVLLVMAVNTVATVAPEYMGRMPREPREYKTAGEWMREYLEPAMILCRKPQIGFYAGMPSSGPAATDGPSEAVARAREIGARYLVVDERYTVKMIPGLKPLLEPAQAPPSLQLLYEVTPSYAGGRVAIYQLTAP